MRLAVLFVIADILANLIGVIVQMGTVQAKPILGGVAATLGVAPGGGPGGVWHGPDYGRGESPYGPDGIETEFDVSIMIAKDVDPFLLVVTDENSVRFGNE